MQSIFHDMENSNHWNDKCRNGIPRSYIAIKNLYDEISNPTDKANNNKKEIILHRIKYFLIQISY